MSQPIKDPDAALDYMVDWGSDEVPARKRWLRDGDTIASSTWTVPTGITKTSDSFDAKTTTVWLEDGTDGEDYDLVNRVTTNQGRTDERTFTIMVRSR